MLGNDGNRCTTISLSPLPSTDGEVLVPTTRHPSGALGSPVHARFPATPDAPARARHFVSDALRVWDLPERLRNDIVLAVSELASDAATYPLAIDIELDLARNSDSVELVVRDSCPEPPLRVDPSSGVGELGRAVLNACTDSWTWSAQPRAGREVRASFRA